MGIGILGPLELDGIPVQLGSRDRTILAALALCPGEVMSPEQLADAVWGADPPPTWSKSVQGCISRLRKQLGPEAIRTSAQGYRLNTGAGGVDAQEFIRLVARVRELLSLGEPERAAYTATEALALWRGRPFLDLEEWGPGTLEAGRLSELRLEVEDLHLEAALQAGHHRAVLSQAQAMVDAAPLRERRWVLLAQAQYQSGRQADALRTVRRLRTVLSRELGLDPGPEVVELEQAILRQDPALLVPSASESAQGKCPYLGLTPYGEADADAFFGRDRDIEACLTRLEGGGLLAVVGPSGSGKSSLVRAGIVVGLRREGRDVVVISPGPHPMDALTELRGRVRSALVVDQGEELFALCGDPDERAQFLHAVAEHSTSAPVVVALRADRMGDLASHAEFAKLVERGLYLLGAMSPDDLRAAVEGPARQAGLVLEPGLVDLLVREVEGEPGALPLMSHALRETWLRREGRSLTVAGYQDSGGIRGAVARSAEDVYARLETSQRHLLRDLLLRLVTPGIEGEPVRTRMPRRQVIVDPDQDELVDVLVTSRLVTSDDGVIELAHEALTRVWPRLRGWLDDDIEGQRILHHLTGSADAWDQLGRPGSELYRGVRLTQAVDWWQTSAPDLTSTERAFLEASTTAAEIERRSAEARARQQERLIRRLRAVVAGAAMLLVAALIAGFLAVRQSERAEQSATAAVAAQTSADARAAGAQALLTDDIDTAMLLAVAGVRLDDSPATRSSLLGTLGNHPELIASTQMTGAPVLRFDISPDGRKVATYDEAHRVRLYEIDSGEMLAEYEAGSDERLNWRSGNVEFSPDGSTLAVVTAAPTRQPVRLLDADTLELREAQPAGTQPWRWQGQHLTYSRDGRFLAAMITRVEGAGATTEATSNWAFVWKSEDPQRPVARIALDTGGPTLALSPDGRLLYTARPLTRYDLRAGTSVELEDTRRVETLAVSPDGRLLAASAAGGAVLLDATTGQIRHELQTGGEDTWMISFSGDGRRVASASPGGQDAFVWAVPTGKLVARLPLAESLESAVKLSPDGSTGYTAGQDVALRQWDLSGSRRFIAQVADGIPANERVVVAPGGGHVAYQSHGSVAFLDVLAGKIGSTVDRPLGSTGLEGSWDPDGERYALPTGDSVTVFDAPSGTVISQGRPSGSEVTGIDFSSDGSRLAITDASGVLMVDPSTLRPVGAPVPLQHLPCAVSLGPDNRTALVATGVAKIHWPFWRVPCTGWALVDLQSGSTLDRGTVDAGISDVDFSPDGGRAALGVSGDQLLVMAIVDGDSFPDVKTATPLRSPFVVHDGDVFSHHFSPDGKQILTSGTDGSAALWDAETGRLVARVVTPELFSVSEFLADGRSVLIAGSWVGGVSRWDTRLETAIDFACRLAGRDLTEAEWTAQFGERPFKETCTS